MPSNSRLLSASLASAAFFVVCLVLLFVPRWESELDVALSMVAHGYGVAAFGAPELVFSNVLWGYLVRAIPEIGNLVGYSAATFGVLIVVGMVVVYGLGRLGAGYLSGVSALVLILARPVLFPNFIVNSGLLLVAAIICWHLYAQSDDRRALLGGCILAFFSYLVRQQEFLLVLVVASPLLPWKILLSRRPAKIAFMVLFSAIAFSAAIDHAAYRGKEWKAHTELDSARPSYSVSQQLRQDPDLLARHGYSVNDIDLLNRYFLVDSGVANPETLRAMQAELGAVTAEGNALSKAWSGVRALWDPNLLPLAIAVLLLIVLRPGWKTGAVVCLLLAAIFALGMAGIPVWGLAIGPVACLLLIAPFFDKTEVSDWGRRFGALTLLVAAVFSVGQVFSESKNFEIEDHQTLQGLKGLPKSPIVLWGTEFPFLAVYPVLGVSSSVRSDRFYGFGAFTLAPFSVAFAEQTAGRGFKDLLVSGDGVPFIATAVLFEPLEVYCRERLGGQLEEISARFYGDVKLSRRRCTLNQ